MILELDAFVRAIAISRSSPHSVFLGAGASISSQIPSAEQCIREWKRSIFLSNNPGMESHFTETSMRSVMDRIQKWLDTQGCYPAVGSPEEYGFYVEKCYPIPDHRRRFFEEKVRKATPSSGYKHLVILAEAGIIRNVWTTNFDALIARVAAGSSLTPIEVTIDAKNRIDRQPSQNELMCVSMHGDYRYDSLKNAPDELREQDAKLAAAFIKHLDEHSLVICGYSGRDQSVMNTLAKAYSLPGTGTLYWCGYGEGDEVSEQVLNLLTSARKTGRQAFYVPTRGFDDLMRRLACHCLDGEKRQQVLEITLGNKSDNAPVRGKLTLPTLPITALIKSNSFRISYPQDVFTFGLHVWPSESPYRVITELADAQGVVAAPLKGVVLALGTIASIKIAFGDNIKDEIKRTPIASTDLRYDDGVVISLLRKALIRSIATSLNLETDQNQAVWSNDSPAQKTIGATRCWVSQMALLHLRFLDCQMYLVIEPSVMLVDEAGNQFDRDTNKALKAQILGYQHNKEFNEAVDFWRKKILNPKVNFEFPINCESPFTFQIRAVPDFVSIGSSDKTTPVINLPQNIRSVVRRSGIELSEPVLLFASKTGGRLSKDWHPLRGLSQNRPFDYPLTERKLSPEVTLGVVCSEKDSATVHAYLKTAHSSFNPAQTEADYLLPYPGFAAAYGLPLIFPDQTQPSWVQCAEPTAGLSPEKGSRELAHSICRAIDSLRATSNPNVVLIYYPDRWGAWREFENEDERFDLHDFVKAYCVQKGVATQFLNQDTLASSQTCRVWWWLSLALYVKSMRIPWILDTLDQDTAYVGLGFCMSRDKRSSKHIVMGCSHIYSAHGEGLQYRLSKIENPIIRNRNPFMSREDATRVAENIQQLFFESRGRLPRRVVLHKLTPFRRDEQLGLLDGLRGVDNVDMLEINVDPCLRYVASKYKGNGAFEGDGFPVNRGTIVPHGDYKALLWVHGVTEHVSRPGYKYFQGKRRIPAPACVTRHCGETDLPTLGTEILGLSKMNWNSFDMYAQLPATVYSSRHIANIGSLLERFNDHSFDYRLFI